MSFTEFAESYLKIRFTGMVKSLVYHISKDEGDRFMEWLNGISLNHKEKSFIQFNTITNRCIWANLNLINKVEILWEPVKNDSFKHQAQNDNTENFILFRKGSYENLKFIDAEEGYRFFLAMDSAEGRSFVSYTDEVGGISVFNTSHIALVDQSETELREGEVTFIRAKTRRNINL